MAKAKRTAACWSDKASTSSRIWRVAPISIVRRRKHAGSDQFVKGFSAIVHKEFMRVTLSEEYGHRLFINIADR